MKLDLIAIRKLSPAGLWDLAELAAVISTLLDLITGGFGGGVSVRRASGMVAQYRRQLHARRLKNFNMQVKAWVLQCPERIAYVRAVIGEVAIKRWRKNHLLDYAFTKAFGDWKSTFPNGLKRKGGKNMRSPVRTLRGRLRTYTWKPFALVKIPNALRILYGQAKTDPAQDAELAERRAAYIKLWDVDITDTSDCEKGTQPRQARVMNPVRFTPRELAPEAATGTPEDIIEAAEILKLTHTKPEIFPLLKAEKTSAEATSSEVEYKPP